MPQWTEQQNNAITARNRNLLVSAAAGSGKTAVLVERVIRLITDKDNPVNADKFLIVTFTNAAAAEMKARIAASLEKIIRREPNNSNAVKQMSLLSSAKICTIDSFCLNLVRDNFFELGISQDFALIDESEAEIIADTALNNVLDRLFEEKDSAFFSLVELLSSPKDDKALIHSIKKLHNYIFAQPFPFDWLDEAAELYNPSVPFSESVWLPCLKNEIADALAFGKRLILQCFDLLCPDDELFDGYTKTLNGDLKLYNNLIKSLDMSWNDIASAFHGSSFGRVASKRGYESPIKAELTAKREIYKNVIKKDLKGLFCGSEADYYEDMNVLYPLVKTLCKVVKLFDDEFMLLKSERGGYTFSDIEHFAINLLFYKNDNGEVIKSKLAEDLRDGFYEILVDEYQDTNEAQDMLFEMLSNGNNRFMVGDVKQSIYRFRLAMPYIFNSKKNSYIDYKPENTGTDSRIILDRNFRSRRGICDFVNFVFSAFMTEKTGELDYKKQEYLNYGADYKNEEVPSAQIKILTETKGEETDSSEAAYIANTIISKIKSGELIKDNDGYRPVKYGDFSILLRSTRNHISVYQEVLTSYGIPVICDNSVNLFENNEIKMLISLLRVIDNPMQDIPLLAVMMSPMYGFTADEMAAIKTEHGGAKANLYTSVVNSDSEKVKDFLNEISMLGKMAVTMSAASFVRYICDFKSLYAFANALGNGEQRCRNIGKFIDFAASFDTTDSIGLTSFLRLIDKVSVSDRGIESASLNASAENAVSIMSVHHSKGLEFPIVMLAGTSRKYNTRDLSDRMLIHPFKGIGIKRHNEELLYQNDTFPYVVIKNLNKTAMMSENLRVLYVAMTRAKEQFISFITVDNLESRVNALAAKASGGYVDSYICKSIQCDGDILLMSALMHPDGRELRCFSDIDIKVRSAEFPLDVRIIGSVDDIDQAEETEQTLPNPDIVKLISEKLEYSYENSELSSVSAKRTASSLDESIKNLDFFASSKPAFMNKNGMTPGERGTAMHTFMQFCNYVSAKKNLEEEIKRLTENGFVSREHADSLDRKALSKLFSSDFANRMFNADNIYREIKVSSFVKARELGEAESDEEILVQGISDCVFEENGKLVLVDYKTDRVKDENQLLDMYKNQIAFYRNAVSKTLGKPVKEAVLYSFYLGKVCYYK